MKIQNFWIQVQDIQFALLDMDSLKKWMAFFGRKPVTSRKTMVDKLTSIVAQIYEHDIPIDDADEERQKNQEKQREELLRKKEEKRFEKETEKAENEKLLAEKLTNLIQNDLPATWERMCLFDPVLRNYLKF